MKTNHFSAQHNINYAMVDVVAVTRLPNQISKLHLLLCFNSISPSSRSNVGIPFEICNFEMANPKIVEIIFMCLTNCAAASRLNGAARQLWLLKAFILLKYFRPSYIFRDFLLKFPSRALILFHFNEP